MWLVVAPEGTAARDVVMDGAKVYVTGLGNVGINSFLTVIAYDRVTGARLWRTDKKPADAGNAAGLRISMAPDGSLVATGQALRGFLELVHGGFRDDRHRPLGGSSRRRIKHRRDSGCRSGPARRHFRRDREGRSQSSRRIYPRGDGGIFAQRRSAVGGVLSSGNGLGRGPAERRRGRDWWLRCLSGSLPAVNNARRHAHADTYCFSNTHFDSYSYSNSYTYGNRYTHSDSYGNADT